MNSKRLVWADSLKGVLIILVILGHAIQNTMGEGCNTNHLWNIIYSFHMPAFMAISGFLSYRPNCIKGEKNVMTLLLRRFRQLIVPFVIWSLLLLLISRNLSLETIGVYLLYPDKGLWFLWVLFFITVFFYLGDWLSGRVCLKQEVIILLFCLIFASSMVVFEFRILGFQFIAYYFILYSLGYYLHKYYDKLITKNSIVIVLLIVIWCVLAWFWQMHDLPNWLKMTPLPNTLVQYAYRFLTASIAIYILFAISPKILNTKSKWNIPFVNLGVISLGIYTVHFIIIGTIVSLFHNWLHDDDLVILFSFISALLVSWGFVWLLNKWELTAKWFLGKI